MAKAAAVAEVRRHSLPSLGANKAVLGGKVHFDVMLILLMIILLFRRFAKVRPRHLVSDIATWRFTLSFILEGNSTC